MKIIMLKILEINLIQKNYEKVDLMIVDFLFLIKKNF